MDYEQDYTRLNRTQIHWYGNEETTAAIGCDTTGQQAGTTDNTGAPDMILDNEDFN